MTKEKTSFMFAAKTDDEHQNLVLKGLSLDTLNIEKCRKTRVRIACVLDAQACVSTI